MCEPATIEFERVFEELLECRLRPELQLKLEVVSYLRNSEVEAPEHRSVGLTSFLQDFHQTN
jgi:hypothetical protein